MITLEEAKREVGPAWANLIEKAYEAIPEGVNILQVKEKFGSLCIYVSHYPTGLIDALDEIETLSMYICEKCGELGELQMRGYWVKTLCKACYEAWNTS